MPELLKMGELAERAGVAKGTLYRYFENKAQLYVAVLSHRGKVFEEKLKAAEEHRAKMDKEREEKRKEREQKRGR